MTVSPVGPGAEVAVPQADFNTGLDDMTQADLSIPRLTIVNKEGMFKDSLSNNKMQSLNVIILGLVKQRTLWPAQVPSGQQSQPMCRSNDFVQGFVNLKQTISPFPYDRAELTQAHVQPRDDGQLVFNCADCKLKEWDTHPLGGKPYCNEVWALPLLMDPFGTGQYLPAVLNLSKTNVTPAKHYLGGFKAAETAAFTAITTISLQLLKRGDNEYSNITFQRAAATDSVNWAEWSGLYIDMRNFLAREPRVFEDKPATAATPQPMAAQPVAAQPVAQPVAQPAPVVQPVVQPAPVAQPAPAAQQAPIQGEVVPNADPWAGQTFPNQEPMQAPAAIQQPVPQAAPVVAAPASVAAPAPTPQPAATVAPAPAPVASAPVTPPAPAAVPTPAPVAAPAPAAVAPTPQPAPSQAVPAPAPTASVPQPTSPAVPQASPQAAPGADNDDLPF